MLTPDSAMGLPLAPDELLLVKTYRRAKALNHAGMDLSIKDGVVVRLQVTEKVDLEKNAGYRKLKE